MNLIVIGWRRKDTIIQKRRPDQIAAGRWEFPGGKLDWGETPDQAVVREFKEEVGVDVVVVQLVDWKVMDFSIGETLVMLYEVEGDGDPISVEGQEVSILEQEANWDVKSHG